MFWLLCSRALAFFLTPLLTWILWCSDTTGCVFLPCILHSLTTPWFCCRNYWSPSCLPELSMHDKSPVLSGLFSWTENRFCFDLIFFPLPAPKCYLWKPITEDLTCVLYIWCFSCKKLPRYVFRRIKHKAVTWTSSFCPSLEKGCRFRGGEVGRKSL